MHVFLKILKTKTKSSVISFPYTNSDPTSVKRKNEWTLIPRQAKIASPTDHLRIMRLKTNCRPRPQNTCLHSTCNYSINTNKYTICSDR